MLKWACADAGVLVGALFTAMPVRGSDRDARATDGARLAAEVGEVSEVQLEGVGRRRKGLQRPFAAHQVAKAAQSP